MLAEEGRPLSHLLLIGSGHVEARAGAVPVRSFSTFPGARHAHGNQGIDSGGEGGQGCWLAGWLMGVSPDSLCVCVCVAWGWPPGAWIGEVNFLDTSSKGGLGGQGGGAIATFVVQSPTRYIQWDNAQLRKLMTEVRDGGRARG